MFARWLFHHHTSYCGFKRLCVGAALLLRNEPYMAQGDKNLLLILRSVLREMSIYPRSAGGIPATISIVDSGFEQEFSSILSNKI
ncbi:hypothetical protein B9T23_03335 [Acinetobacter terrae]|nr:hypothetical protein B9T23_03335 [Acinetobacter terrae]